MASPFDFSAFLLTPPIPNYSNNYSTGNSAGRDSQSRQANNDGSNNDANSNNYTSALSAPGPGYAPPNTFAGQGDQSLMQSQTSYPQQLNSETYQPRQQTQQQSGNYLGDQLSSDAQGTYGSFNPSSFGGYQDSRSSQQVYSSSVPSASGMLGQSSSNLPPIASGSNSNRLSQPAAKMPSLDERDYGLDPSAFSNVTFQMPSFLQASSQPGEYGDGPAVVDPSAFRSQQSQQSQGMSIFQPDFMNPSTTNQQVAQTGAVPSAVFRQPAQTPAQVPSAIAPASEKKQYVPDPKNPIYGIYGSSVISVNPDPSPFKLALNNAIQPILTAPTESRSGSPDFDPKSLGLPVGDQLFPQALPGLYSSSGFDMLGVLARVVARPNPQINVGPVDTSCSFLVVDARRYDMPIVFASDTFSKLTGYHNVSEDPLLQRSG